VVSLQGVFPPIPTPFDQEGAVHLAALQANLQRWKQFGLDGYVVLGSNGEAVYLSESERLQVLEAARDEIPADKTMIAGAGGESTRQTVSLAVQAAKAGADAVLVITPHYYGGKMTRDSLVSHFKAVADASRIPLVLYNVPKFTHLDMDAETVALAAEHPNIIGIKDSAGNIAKLADIVRLGKAGFQVLAGSASFFFAGLALGAVGGVLALANVAPQQCMDIHRLFRAGNWEEAAELQRAMLPVNAAITARFGIAGLKRALDLLGYYGGPVRSPLLGLKPEEEQVLERVLVEGGVLDSSQGAA
jgi:4-hydroxy-2-oxoglutarate aldolase